jgi:hypothetical protein
MQMNIPAMFGPISFSGSLEVLFVLSLMASDYLFVILKLFLAEKSTTEISGSKVINRVCFVFVCGCSFFIQCWWMLSSLYSSFKSECNMQMICLSVTVPKIQGVEIGPKFNLSKKSPFQLTWPEGSCELLPSLGIRLSDKKIIKKFSQSEAFMAPGSHVG